MFENWECWDVGEELVYALKADYGFRIIVSFSAENNDRWWFDCHGLRGQRVLHNKAFPVETLRELMLALEDKQKSVW